MQRAHQNVFNFLIIYFTTYFTEFLNPKMFAEANLQTERLSSALECIRSILQEESSDWESEIAYLGFSPDKLRDSLTAISTANGLSPIQHMKAMRNLCHLYLQRGTNFIKMKAKTDLTFWRNSVDPLVTRYDIKSSVIGASTAVTLGRIANAHPE